jgi:DnaJ-class molecular chaperone
MNNKNKYTCATCFGAKYIENIITKECPKCNGYGKIYEASVMNENLCIECLGRGIIIHKIKRNICPMCHGKGFDYR